MRIAGVTRWEWIGLFRSDLSPLWDTRGTFVREESKTNQPNKKIPNPQNLLQVS